MSKISIAYVGDKPFKKDTITGSLLVFPQFTPIDVEPDVAFMLLQYPKVWVREEAIKGVIDEMKAQADAKALALEEAKKQAAIEAKENDFTVNIAGDNVDLAKLNSAKLATLIEAHDLNVDPKGAQEQVTDFRIRVRDALRG